MKRLLPHPVFSLALWLFWLLISNSVAPGALLLGAALAIALPLYSHNFWPYRSRVHRPARLAALFGRVVLDIVIANFHAAKLILGPRASLRPGFITVPLELTDPVAITMLTSFISLTPGTVSAELSTDQRQLSVHSLDIDDAEALVRHIKQRYETPLLEIFSC